MQNLNLQLYARTTTKSFNELLSVRDTVRLSAIPNHVALSITPPEGEEIVELRLDPDDKPSAFILHGLSIASGEGQHLYSWDGTVKSLPGLVDISPESTKGRVVLKCTSGDPNIRISLPSPHLGTILLKLSVSHALLPARKKGTEESDPADAFQLELAEAIFSLQSSFSQALEGLGAEIEGVQDALRICNASAEAGSTAQQFAVRQLEDVLESGRRFEEQTIKLQDQLHAGTQAIDNKLDNMRMDEPLALLRDYIKTESEVLNTSLRENLGAAIIDLSTESQGEFGKIAAQLASFADSSQLLQQIRAELNVAQDELIVTSVQQLMAEIRVTREKINTMETSLAWRLTHPFASFSKAHKGPLG